MVSGTNNYIANRRSKEVHKSDCIWALRMASSNKMPCGSLHEVGKLILDSRYNGYFYCLPRYDTDTLTRQQVRKNISEDLYPYIANQRSKEIHESGCRWVLRIADSNKIPCFSLHEVADLIRGGYNGCFYCLSRYDTDTLTSQQVLTNLEEDLREVEPTELEITFLTKWGSLGSDDGQFNGPWGITVDSVGHLYVIDRTNQRVQVFSSDGKFITKWGSRGSGDGQFLEPIAITIDKLGLIYVSEMGNNRVQVFSSDGKFITKWGSFGMSDSQLYNPEAMAIDEVGHIYVTNAGNHQVKVFSSDGEFITKWGFQGSSNGQFNGLRGIAVDRAGYVYVADSGNHRIQKFSSSGEFLTKWGSKGTGNGQFHAIIFIALDDAGHVYVTEYDNHRVQVFSLRRVPDRIMERENERGKEKIAE